MRLAEEDEARALALAGGRPGAEAGAGAAAGRARKGASPPEQGTAAAEAAAAMRQASVFIDPEVNSLRGERKRE